MYLSLVACGGEETTNLTKSLEEIRKAELIEILCDGKRYMTLLLVSL